MCGITGFIGPGNRDDLDRMMAALTHRGPDAAGHFCDPDQGVFLGHRRLIILDPQGGKQPHTTSDGQLSIVYNGEIYNHLCLRKELRALGHQFTTDHSDTETLLLAYRAWGEAMQDRLNGMWAFVIYDRVKHQFFCSRDRFGQKPFYFATYPGGFAFGSELTALLMHRQVPRHQDPRAIRKYYGYGYFPAPHTPYSAIRKLAAGKSITVKLSNPTPQIRCWWQFHLEPQPLYNSEDAWCEALRERLATAVQRRLMADVPLGILLSGGIDSSSVAWFANRASQRPLPSFALGFEQQSFDERIFAQQAAHHIGTDHRETILTWPDAVASMARIVRQLDEPLGDSSLIPTAHLCAFARKHITVALAGDGADELFAGYDPFLALNKARAYAAMVPKTMHRAIRLLAAKLPVSQSNMALSFKINKTLEGLDQPRPFWIPTWMAPLPANDLSELFQTPIHMEDLYEEAITAWSDEPVNDLTGQALQFYTRLYLADGILAKVDRASMMHSLEVRAPFLDIELVDLARRMPHHLKRRGNTSKYILKKAMTGLLPDSLLMRRKKGFGMPIGAWFQEGRVAFPCGPEPFPHRVSIAKNLYAVHMKNQRDMRLFLWSYWVHHQVQAKQNESTLPTETTQQIMPDPKHE